MSARLIAMAVSLVGGSDVVQKHLHCSDADFIAYCNGHKELDTAALEAVVALIVHEQGNIIAKNRELLAELRQRRDAEKPAS
jgi:hypothetical protein